MQGLGQEQCHKPEPTPSTRSAHDKGRATSTGISLMASEVLLQLPGPWACTKKC